MLYFMFIYWISKQYKEIKLFEIRIKSEKKHEVNA